MAYRFAPGHQNDVSFGFRYYHLFVCLAPGKIIQTEKQGMRKSVHRPDSVRLSRILYS